MIPVINKRDTGLNICRIMDECKLTVRDVQG